MSKPERNVHPQYRPDIDGLRAVAILSVLIFHAFPSFLKGGFVGVDIFFVISGFLISNIIFKSLHREDFRLSEFYIHRIKRIFPALFLVLSACYILGWFELLPSEFKQLGKHIAAGAGFSQNIILQRESGYFDTASELKPLIHLWSLAIEEQFYLIYPVLIIILWRMRINILCALCILFAFSFGLNALNVEKNPIDTFFFPQTRFWELLAGCILAQIQVSKKFQLKICPSINTFNFEYIRINKKKWNDFQSILGIIFIGFSIFGIRDEQHFPGWLALAPVAGAFLLISSGPNAWINRYVLANRIMVWIGLISYPLYLLHWPVISMAKLILPDPLSLIFRIAAIFASILLAWVIYNFIEKPIRQGSKHWIKPATLSILMIIVGCLGFNAWKNDGLPSRGRVAGVEDFAKITDVYTYFDYRSLMRVGVCHSVPIASAYANGCIRNEHPSIFILGDSYAAALYSGLLNLVKNRHPNYIVNQLTDGNGPPFFSFDEKTDEGKSLQSANEDRLDAVEKTKPEIVIISWMLYGKNGITDKVEAVRNLAYTIEKIKLISPKSRVIVIGPVPEWDGSLLKQLINFYRANRKLPPIYMSFGLNRNIKPWDDYLKIEVPKNGAEYISAYDQLCNNTGCLTRTSNSPHDLTAVDWGHLSKVGSIYLMDNIEKFIFLDQ